MKGKPWLTMLCLTVLLALAGCGKSPPHAEKLKQDLTEGGWQNDLFVQTVESVNTFAILPYQITELEITKRDTVDKIDTVWYEFTADNTAVEVSGTGTASYYFYTEGGWQLEGFTVDTQTSKPIAPPSEADCMLNWDSDWAWYDQDMYSAKVKVTACDLDSTIPAATAIYETDNLTDGDISFLSGVFQLDFEFYDGIGWRAVNLTPAAIDEAGNTWVSLSFSKDICKSHQVSIPFNKTYYAYNADFVIDEIHADGTVSGMIRYGGFADVPFAADSYLHYTLTGAYLEVYVDTTSGWYVDGEVSHYRIQITGSDWWTAEDAS